MSVKQYDADTGLEVVVKQPWEDLVVDMDLTNRMRAGDSISSVDAVVFVNQGKVPGSGDITLSSGTFSGTIAQVRVSGGQDQENYKLSYRCNTTLGDKIEGDGMLYVRD